MKHLFIILALLTIVSCKKTVTLAEMINNGVASDKNPTIPTSFLSNSGIHTGKNLIFITDASCSVCKSEYYKLAECLNYNYVNYDSLFVFVENDYSPIELEYIIESNEIPVPENITYFYDKTLIDSISHYTRRYNFAVVNDNRFVYLLNIQSLEYKQGIGLHINIK